MIEKLNSKYCIDIAENFADKELKELLQKKVRHNESQPGFLVLPFNALNSEICAGIKRNRLTYWHSRNPSEMDKRI